MIYDFRKKPDMSILAKTEIAQIFLSRIIGLIEIWPGKSFTKNHQES